MKINNFFKRAAAVVMVLSLGLAFSCSDKEKLNLDNENVVDESLSDYYFEDIDDMSGLSMIAATETDEGVPGGRVSGVARNIMVNDKRLECATVAVELDPTSTSQIPKGTITVDFGTAGTCKDLRGNARKGKVVINFTGRRFMPTSQVIITLVDYSINGVVIEGTRTLKNIQNSVPDAPEFQISLVGGKIHWLDGNVTLREHYFVRKWIRATNPLDDELQISFDANSSKAFTAQGTNKFGRSYTMTITKTLVYKRCSPIAVEGTKEFSDGDKIITIDYGVKADCDRKITITIAGDSRVVGV